MRSSATIATLFLVGSFQLGGSQTIDPSTVNQTTKANWCSNQKSSCPLICLQTANATQAPLKNDCDATSLVYSCVCANGLQPNASEFSLTIPYFECTEYGNQCVAKCNGDSACQSACRTNNPCGAQNPVRVTLSTTSTTSALATATQSGATKTTGEAPLNTGFGTAQTSTSSGGSGGSSGAEALAINFGRTYGLALILAAICGGFMVML